MAGRIGIAMLALAGVAACGVVTALTVWALVGAAGSEDAAGGRDDRDGPPLDSQPPGRPHLISHQECNAVEPNENVARAAIDDRPRDAECEEREILSPEMIRKILSRRRQLATLPRVEELGGRTAAAADAAPPRLLKEKVQAVSPHAAADELNLLESAIEAIRAGQQAILNNIANANTIGFKRNRPLFSELPPRHLEWPGQIDQHGRPATTGAVLGTGVCLRATQADFSQGRLRHTRQSLDLAIQGDGYFQINEGNRFTFTRVGSFSLNANGEIVLAGADRNQPLEPAFAIPHDIQKIEVSTEGIVSVLVSSETEMTQVGLIQLARFVNPQGLVAIGDGRFQATVASGNPLVSNPTLNGLGTIHQGYLEESNVTMADELADLRRLREQLNALLRLHGESSGTVE